MRTFLKRCFLVLALVVGIVVVVYLAYPINYVLSSFSMEQSFPVRLLNCSGKRMLVRHDGKVVDIDSGGRALFNEDCLVEVDVVPNGQKLLYWLPSTKDVIERRKPDNASDVDDSRLFHERSNMGYVIASDMNLYCVSLSGMNNSDIEKKFPGELEGDRFMLDAQPQGFPLKSTDQMLSPKKYRARCLHDIYYMECPRQKSDRK